MPIWVDLATRNTDGSQSIPDLDGNEMVLWPDGSSHVIPHGFANPLGMKFADKDGIEYIVLREIEQEYKLDLMAKCAELDDTSLVVDIGAHVGVVSMHLALKYHCKVEAYEPAPDNYRRLAANIRLNGLESLVFPYPVAVTRDGRDVMLGGDFASNSGSMSIFRKDNAVSCLSVTLADIIRDRHIDLLKIDCEGAEYEILEDLTPLHNVGAFLAEFHPGIIKEPLALFKRIQAIVPKTRISLQAP